MSDFDINDESVLQSIIGRRTKMNDDFFELTFKDKTAKILNDIQVIQEQFEEKLEHCDDANLAYLFGKMRVHLDNLSEELNETVNSANRK